MTRNDLLKKVLFAALPLLFVFAACHSEKKEAKMETGGVILEDTENLSEKDLFFKKKLFPELRKQNYSAAQQMLNDEIKAHPEYQKEPLFFSARGLIHYHNGEYGEAYKDATRVINVMEQRFAPKKPYQANFQSEKARESIASHYLYRYQALMKLGKYTDALDDVETALKIVENPRVMLIKAHLLILLKRYDDAAAEMNRAWKLDKDVLDKEGENAALDICTIFHERGYEKVNSCKETFLKIEEMQKEAEERE